MSTNNEWIKMSERKPTEDEKRLNVIYGGYVNGRWETGANLTQSGVHLRTHWTIIPRLPAPPAPEPTQREEDESGFLSFINQQCKVREYPVCRDAWHAALAWERSEILKLLQHPEDKEGFYVYPRALHDRLRRRCGLDK